jgi:hypothetical protein
VYGRRFKQVVIDLVEVGDGADVVCCDVALVVEGFEAAPDAKVLSFFGLWLCVRGVSVAVDPLLDVDEAGAIVDFVGCIGGLGLDGVDLADEG